MIVLVAHDETKLVCESCDVERVKADGNWTVYRGFQWLDEESILWEYNDEIKDLLQWEK